MPGTHQYSHKYGVYQFDTHIVSHVYFSPYPTDFAVGNGMINVFIYLSLLSFCWEWIEVYQALSPTKLQTIEILEAPLLSNNTRRILYTTFTLHARTFENYIICIIFFNYN